LPARLFQVWIVIKSEVKYNIDDDNYYEGVSYAFSRLENTDFNTYVGFGITKKERYISEVKYEQGSSDIFSGKEVLYNRSISLNAGYSF